jgi:hypothetical protein
VAQFMDFHPDLKLPDEAIQQLRQDAASGTYDEFGVRQVELYHNAEGHVYCLLEAPNAEAVRKHHEAIGVTCGNVHEVNSLA